MAEGSDPANGPAPGMLVGLSKMCDSLWFLGGGRLDVAVYEVRLRTANDPADGCNWLSVQLLSPDVLPVESFPHLGPRLGWQSRG